MDIWDHIVISINSLASNKFRTFLTTLGIIIGVAAVITLLGVGKGAQDWIEASFEEFGSENLYIVSGKSSFGAGPPGMEQFTKEEYEKFVKYPKKYISGVSAYLFNLRKVQYKNESDDLQVMGLDGDFEKVFDYSAEKGRMYSDKDSAKRAKVCLIGPDLVEDLFNNTNPIGERIKIQNTEFTVIGILNEKSGSNFDNPNKYVLVPMSTFTTYLSTSDNIPFIVVSALDQDYIDKAQEEAKEIWRDIRDIKKGEEDNFTIRDAGELLSTIQQFTGVLTIFLAAIAAISLLVGGIGVMNIMFVSITERTKEIGLRKSIGARNNDILIQFLTESMVVSQLGGLVGMVLGIFLSNWLSKIAGLPGGIYVDSIIISIIFSLVVGLIFGIYPAVKAAKLNPIDALRYE